MFADMKSEAGRPAGYGTVRFKSPDDAAKAIGILCCVMALLVQLLRNMHTGCPLLLQSLNIWLDLKRSLYQVITNPGKLWKFLNLSPF